MKKKILFVGGSNGALEIVKIAYKFNQMFPNVIIFVITGFRYYETYQFNQNARVYKKIDNISSIFNRFDLIVSRAGASTIAEILATNSVAVLFPSKNVSANHQVKNAQYLKNLAAVEMILNLDDESVQTIYSLLNDEEKRKLIKSNSNAIFLKDSLNELRKEV